MHIVCDLNPRNPSKFTDRPKNISHPGRGGLLKAVFPYEPRGKQHNQSKSLFRLKNPPAGLLRFESGSKSLELTKGFEPPTL